MPFIIVDLDGTLCNDVHRSHFAKAKQWGLYHGRLIMDGLNREVAQIVRGYFLGQNSHPTASVILLAGRPEEYRDISDSWLQTNHVPYDELIMRPTGSLQHSLLLKKEAYLKLAQDDNCILAIDDRKDICDLWASFGIPTIQFFQRKSQ